MAEKRYHVGDMVEYQPHHGNQPRGASYNTTIQEVLPNDEYRIIRKGKDKIIKHRHILCGNWGAVPR